MSLRKFIAAGLLLAIGFLLRGIVPPMFFGMKPDLSLIMLFVIIVMMVDDVKIVFTAGIAAGILAALTTNFPGGQIANIVDKIITTTLVYIIVRNTKSRFSDLTISVVVGCVGTLISGSIFLLTALLLFGLPTSFKALFLTIVLPTALINTPISGIIFTLLTLAKKATGFSIQQKT